MTAAEAIRAATARLSGTSDTARLDAELLMAHALRVSRSDLLLRGLAVENWDAPDSFKALVDRRAACEPLAYIVGSAEFYGRPFRVTPDVLIPRPDSESVVDAALEAAPGATRVLDLGTGSGALLLILLRKLPEATGVGIDASAAALEIAAENALVNRHVAERAEFRARDWTQAGWADDLGRFDLVICNPPYVENDAELQRDVREYEPASALFAGPDGLDDYRVLIPQLPALLTGNGVAVLEIGHTQAEAVGAIAAAAGFSTTLRQDLGGRPRALILSLDRGESR
ncbi:peptide chain release factor N(5)-glutamine methyltransferase [Alteriqipengyuania flavescens]|uniref:peptide chain release factor N(5)-glutamine methyltransferase n=1 Tax=Alteriqipengyuania flavescens TaxID=3053610 RepID=UPI0025B42D3C|nr:peptide chain release factor N(5)-glutamine methyltransferase [Alteriqipengyuania flavescens]WJY19765.1 peptide chain release factor N(5)-glutamine methyltransferase [Alteriqipengyuania flavescens]WJY25707.1 peptide chain release factor N(5)-glutamine methyltransferase [Alteriqipengyuania flavescens]